jgi:hypothetical protein
MTSIQVAAQKSNCLAQNFLQFTLMVKIVAKKLYYSYGDVGKRGQELKSLQGLHPIANVITLYSRNL